MAELALDQYENQKVVLVRYVTDDEGNTSAEESEGTVLTVNQELGGILFKPKGRVQALLVMVDDVESIDFAPIKEKAIVVRYLREVKFGNARQHLADRHGVELSVLSELDEGEALARHEEIDHSGLSHQHGEKPESNEAAAESEDDEE